MENDLNLPTSSEANRKEMACSNDKKPLPAKSDKDNDNISDSKSNFDTIVKCLGESVLVENLHDVLSFLLSDRTELSFPNASHYAELFLMNMLKDLDNLDCQYFNKRCASMSKQIIKVLDNNKNVYKCVSDYQTIDGKNVLLFKKQTIPKTYEKTCSEGDACCTTSTLKSISENLHSECPNHHTHKVSQTFKTRWLKATLRFIKDDSKHNLKYPEMSPMEATYVYSLITRCKEQTDMAPDSYYTPLREAMQIFGLKYFFELTYIDTFPNGKMSLMLEKIPKNIKSLIEGDKGTVNRFRNMKYIKQPKSRTSDEHRAGKVVSRLKSLKPECSNKLFNAFPAPPRDDNCCRVTEEPVIEPAARSMTDLDNATPLVTKRNRKNKSGKSISFNPSGPEVLELPSAARRRERSCEKRTDKLLKAMSVPIKSDKAMKMMYGMGWDGGALGARGDGITEPIIPALDIKVGAGLGHTASPKRPQKKLIEAKKAAAEVNEEVRTIKKVTEIKAPNPKNRTDYRMDVLACIFDLITSEDTNMEMKLANAITKRDRGFMEHAVRAANERNNIGVNETNGLNLWGRILDEMTCNPDLHLKLAVSDDKKSVILSKDDTPYLTKKKKRKLQKRLSIQNIPSLPKGNRKVITNEFLHHLSESYIAPFAGTRVSTKANTGISFRVAVILHILEMVKNNRQKTEIAFERLLNDVERDYVENTAVQVALRKKRGGSKLEHELLTEIKDNIEGFTLRVEFLNDQKSFILHRVEMKQTDKIPRDVSCATCSTDNNDKNEICSDDSDVGHDDILDIDYNEDIDPTDDENNESIEVSEEKSIDIHDVKTGVQEDTSVALDTDEDEKILLESTSEEDKEVIDAKEFEDDTMAEDIELDVSKMDVQDLDKVEELDHLNPDAEHVRKGAQFDGLQTEVPVLSQHADLDVSKTEIQVFKDTNTGVCNNCDAWKTDVQNLDKKIELDDISAKDIVKYQKTEDCKHNGTFKKESGNNVSETNMKKIEKNNFLKTLKKDLLDMPKNLEVHASNNDAHNLDEIDCKPLKTVEKDSIKYTDPDVLSVGETILDKNKAASFLRPCDNKIDKYNTNLEEKEKLEDIKQKENAPDITHALSIEQNPEPKLLKINQVKYIKRVYLVPDDYPKVEVNTEFAKNIQILISKHIEESTELPLLKCHGVQDGALVYSCHSEKTLKWLENVCVSNNIKIIIPVNDEVRYKMSLMMNSFIEYTSAKLFKMLQLYNEGLPTDKWIELSVEKSSDTLTFIVEIDEKSLKYIKESNFTMFAGIDQVQFNVMWN